MVFVACPLHLIQKLYPFVLFQYVIKILKPTKHYYKLSWLRTDIAEVYEYAQGWRTPNAESERKWAGGGRAYTGSSRSMIFRFLEQKHKRAEAHMVNAEISHG